MVQGEIYCTPTARTPVGAEGLLRGNPVGSAATGACGDWFKAWEWFAHSKRPRPSGAFGSPAGLFRIPGGRLVSPGGLFVIPGGGLVMPGGMFVSPGGGFGYVGLTTLGVGSGTVEDGKGTPEEAGGIVGDGGGMAGVATGVLKLGCEGTVGAP